MPVWRSVVWLSVLWASLTWAQIYKWTDRQGTVYFTDNPSRIPAEYRPQVAVESPVSPTPPEVPSGDATTAAQTDEAAPGESPPRDRLGRGPDYWRTLARQWSTRLQQSLQERDRLQLLYLHTRQLADATRDVWDRGNLEAEASQLQQAITGVDAQIKEAETMLQTTLPLEAVQLGADPHWLKPPAVTQP